MTCSSCGTELPLGAIFCGECGRPVPAGLHADPASPPAPDPLVRTVPFAVGPVVRATPIATAAVVSTIPVSQPMPAPAEEPAEEPAVVDPAAVEEPAAERCAQCGALLAASDIFCGECGFVRQAVGHAGQSRPNDTVALDPFPWGLPRESEPWALSSTPDPAVPAEAVVPPEPVVPPDPPMSAEAVVPPQAVALPEAELPPDAAMPADPVLPELLFPFDPPILREPVAPSAFYQEPDIENTRIVDRAARGERFVLQFSTGESVSVSGTGLIGRNPLAEPGEYFDAFVAIVDPGRSVSKTHLEFGQDSGMFWVSDRYSANGTVAREPDSQPRRCDPGKRYRLRRGTRVDIGEQFFIIS